MLKIYLSRHGQDQDNANKILNGRRDTPLTDIGISQAEEVAKQIIEHKIKFDKIYCSPLKRAYQTASIISEKTNSQKPEKLDLLIERDFGVMTGKKTSEIEALCSPNIIKTDTITYFLNPEGAETFDELLKRSNSILKAMKQNHKNGSILIVTHGDLGKMIYSAYYNLKWQDVLTMFHFGNSELLLLSEDSDPENTHIFKIKQHNH